MNKWLISKVLQYSKLKGGFPPPQLCVQGVSLTVKVVVWLIRVGSICSQSKIVDNEKNHQHHNEPVCNTTNLSAEYLTYTWVTSFKF